ncbi:Chaperone protein HtpG [Candidatus Ecksteinia adelgidicola]|nr:Chaperone protein HtpG [Candidatus Ecksteinia adelgidicola]
MHNKETRGFQSEVKQLLHLMIHSLYSNKEIFLRELISNASDAINKLRFRALSEPELYLDNNELCIYLSVNKEKRLLTISDNGIGMNKNEVIENLGTIAKSGTKAFLESVDASKIKDNQLIGKFGVGFYSSFIVANKVTVHTRSIDSITEEGVFWESTGKGDYTIAKINKNTHGTEVILNLREGEDEYLDTLRLRSIVNKYSDHISWPVKIENKNEKDGIITWEKINEAQALWTRNKIDIKDEEYKKFYKHLTQDATEPLIWSHNKVEGKHEYISLLYIPSHTPLDMWNTDYKHGLKLYVHRVFIMDDTKQFMPKYLRFVRGLIDSSDLPLNVSREVLQNNYIVKNLRSALTKRILQMLNSLAIKNPEKYQNFWKQFGLVLKEGPAEDSSNQLEIAKLLRFSSTYDNSNKLQNQSLEDYISRMIEGQEKIYYVTADSYTSAKSSPHLEIFLKKGIEVLLLSDRIDEWMINHLMSFKNKPFQLISKADKILDKLVDKTEEKKTIEKTLEPFLNRVKTLLGQRVKDVRLTYRLIDTPAVVITDSDEISTQMAKLFASAGQTAPEIKYIFELNPDHKLIKHIINISDDLIFSEWINILLDQSLLIEKGTLENPNKFVQRINKLLFI